MRSRLLALLLCLAALPASVHAGGDGSKNTTVCEYHEPFDAFGKGALDLQVMSGLLFSVQRTTFLRPNIDYDLGVVRFGYMFDNAYGHGWLRGNDEFMLEAAGGSIWVGPGSGLGGLSLIYRRNFLWPSVQSRLVPYLDGGVGGIYTDAYHTYPQRALGAPFEFDLQAGLGLRFRVSPKWSLDAEANFRHLSNAGLAGRNYGTNDIGGIIGLSRAF